MACDVGQYLPVGDSVVAEIEDLAHRTDRMAIPRRQSLARGRRFRTRANVKLDIVGWPAPEMVLSGHQNSRGDIYIELQGGDRILRKLHTHDCHHNPGGKLIPGTHMHFPSREVPLLSYGRSYAYQLKPTIDTLGEGVDLFCRLLNISVDGIQGFLGD